MISQLLHASQWCWRHRMKRMGSFFEKVMILTCSAHISGKADIARSVSFAHGGIGVIVNPASSIGEGTVVDTHVVIGNRYPHPGCPKIGSSYLLQQYVSEEESQRKQPCCKVCLGHRRHRPFL